MELLVPPPVLPMLAKRTDELPVGDAWNLRAESGRLSGVVFRDRDEVLIQSRDASRSTAISPTLVDHLKRQTPGKVRTRRRAGRGA